MPFSLVACPQVVGWIREDTLRGSVMFCANRLLIPVVGRWVLDRALLLNAGRSLCFRAREQEVVDGIREQDYEMPCSLEALESRVARIVPCATLARSRRPSSGLPVCFASPRLITPSLR